MTSAPTGTGIGQPVRRREDLRLITGHGRYSDDLNLPGQVYAVMLRSPHAHARIRAIDTAQRTRGARRAGGIDRARPSRPTASSRSRTRRSRPIRPRSCCKSGRLAGVRRAASAVADRQGAIRRRSGRDGGRHHGRGRQGRRRAHRGRLRAAAGGDRRGRGRCRGTRRGCGTDAASNICIDASVGDPAKTEAAFAAAAHVVKLATLVQRIAGVPMEPRAAVATYDPATGRYTLYAGGGSRGAPEARSRRGARRAARAGACGDARRRRQYRNARRLQSRVRAGRLGGAAGRAAGQMDLRAPRVVPQRLPGTRSRARGRAGARRGRPIPGDARLRHLVNIGAHTVSFATLQKSVEIMTSIYHVPAACFRARAVLTNTVPDAALSRLRPAGGDVRDGAADRSRRPQDRHRPHRIAPPEPDPGAIDAVHQSVRDDYDSGHYHQVDGAGAGARPTGTDFAARRAEDARRRGKCRGIGVANYVDTGDRRAARARRDHRAPRRRARAGGRHRCRTARATRPALRS